MVGNVPEETDRFVGRAVERQTLASTLVTHRLTTLTGTGGVGKTRLAVHTLHSLTDQDIAVLGDVCWADLGALPDDRLLIPTVADAVDLADHTPGMPIDALCDWLSDRPRLLVLDSCEHLVEACRSLVTDLLTACPRLTVLITSRQPLDVRGETLLGLEPLPCHSDALALLLERAAAVAPGARTDQPGHREDAAEICRLLDGLPLALELASAQLAHHSPRQLAARLRSHQGELQAAAPIWPRRHRTLRTAIGWSHELCEPLERLLWARLSVFRGSFDDDSVRGVCAGGPLAPDTIPVALAGLIAKSVVGQDTSGRYRLLDTVREYGAMWLAELREQDAAAARHADHFVHLARLADEGWLGTEQVTWYRRITRSHTDLCAALDHLAAVEPERALELIGRIAFFWSCCGHLREARSYLGQALLLCDTESPARARARWALGVVVLLQGSHDQAAEIGEECARTAARDGDVEGRIAAAYLLGITHLLSGEPHAALDVADSALRQTAGPVFASPSVLRCHLVRIFALTGLGRLDEAAARAASLREDCAARDECWTRAYTDYQLALIALAQDDPARAAEHARAMLDGKRRLGDSFGIALGMDVLAAAAAALGQGETSAMLSGTGQTYWRSVGHGQRGTPELRDVRDVSRDRARAAVGIQIFEHAFRRGAEADPRAVLALAVEGRLLGQA
ncbi:ATP-binding protein [Streptomyces sp. NPDC055239]